MSGAPYCQSRLAGAAHVCRHGVQVGGATGLVGDPTGRSTERAPLQHDVVTANVASITAQLSLIMRNGLAYAGKHLPPADGARLAFLDNRDFYSQMNVLDFVGQVGRHARVSAMLARESVKNRLASADGLSFAELMYQLFQAYDYHHLYKERGCRVQLGGSDQWGNITAGIDLIQRRTDADALTVRTRARSSRTDLPARPMIDSLTASRYRS